MQKCWINTQLCPNKHITESLKPHFTELTLHNQFNHFSESIWAEVKNVKSFLSSRTQYKTVLGFTEKQI